MAEITIDGVKYTNVPNKKAGTKFSSPLTQSNIGVSQAVQDYVNSTYFYPLVNAIDINWNGIEVAENTYINTTSDLVSYIASKESDIDLSSYATVSYVNQKIEDLVGTAPETLDTLQELAEALQNDATLAYVTEGLASKADLTYVTTELATKADANNTYTKSEVDEKINAIDLSAYATTSYVTSELATKADADNTYTKAEVDEKINAIDLSAYATTSYVTTELNKKADADNTYTKAEVDAKIGAIDLSSYATVSYVTSNYVPLSSYNALAARVEELAQWIVSYHTPTPPTPTPTFTFTYGAGAWTVTDSGMQSVSQWLNNTTGYTPEYASSNPNVMVDWSTGILSWTISGESATITASANAGQYTASMNVYCEGGSSKQNPYCQWLNSDMNPCSQMRIVEGDTTTYTFTFSGTPASGWSFSDPYATGVTVNSSTGEITVNGTNMSGRNNYYVEATYPEDSEYYYHMQSFGILVLPTGSNPDFYYGESSVNLDSSSMTSVMPTLNIYLDNYTYVDYASSDTTVATVEDRSGMNPGTINYVGGGSCTVTATAYDINDMAIATATISVYCSQSKSSPYTTWMDSNGTSREIIGVIEGDTTPKSFTFIGSPVSGWTFYDPLYTGVTVNTSTGEITVDATNMTSPTTISVSAEYPEDQDYYAGYGQFRIKVLPQGSNTEFFYIVDSMYLTSYMTEQPSLYNNTGYTTNIVYSSSDTSVADVDQWGTVSWISGGSCTITATLYDDNNITQIATATISVECETPAPSKEWPQGSWLDSNMNPVTMYGVVSGDTTTYTLTFNGSPASGWTFSDPMYSGITVSQLTGEITIDPTNMSDNNLLTITADYMEDMDYYGSMTSITIRVLPTGSNADFYYVQNSVTLDSSMMPTETPMLHNAIGYNYIDYTSSDTTVATVDGSSGMSPGTIHYVGGGSCTVTATAYDINDMAIATATITVYCQAQLMNPSVRWTDDGYSEHLLYTVVADSSGTIEFNPVKTPSNGAGSWSYSLIGSDTTGISLAQDGTITIVSPMLTNTRHNVNVEWSYSGDTEYNYGSGTFNILVLPAGSNTNFYYVEDIISLDNNATTWRTPSLINMLSNYDHVGYASSDTTVATVTNDGTVYYAGSGNCTVTASAYDNNNIVIATATITVECTLYS